MRVNIREESREKAAARTRDPGNEQTMEMLMREY